MEELSYFKIKVVICQIYDPTVLDLILSMNAGLSDLSILGKLCHTCSPNV